jgi:hypothetical protein
VLEEIVHLSEKHTEERLAEQWDRQHAIVLRLRLMPVLPLRVWSVLLE